MLELYLIPNNRNYFIYNMIVLENTFIYLFWCFKNYLIDISYKANS